MARLVEKEPNLLVVDISAVLAELRRLLGPSGDPVQVSGDRGSAS